VARARKTPVTARDAHATPAAGATRGNRRRADALQQALPLETGAAPAPPPQAPLGKAVERLWFCVCLPGLPLEALASGDEAMAVVEEVRGMHRVLRADRRATAAGVTPGQPANAALALLPELVLEERSPLREQQALESLAAWLEQYSSFVSIAAEDVLLLEVAGSLRLFGGLRKLRRQIAAGLEEQGYEPSLAIAPTPLAATWLARAGRRACIRDPDNLMPVLRALPLACLDWPRATCESLAGMGIDSIGDCLRLPRDGFARRFGAKRLLELDRALGRLPDPRPSWRAPERFVAEHEMTEEQSDSERLLALCRELLDSHERFLLARQLGTQRLRFTFFHLKAPATRLTLGSAMAERSAGFWFDLLAIRFERLVLAEPVIAIRLEGGRNRAIRTDTARLVLDDAPAPGSGYSMAQLAERLAARIGGDSVERVASSADHRPQFAWRASTALAGPTADVLAAVRWDARRPLWMLPEPLPIDARNGVPVHEGRLTLLEGPERLETGWWDEHGIARDYYTAVNPGGIRLWIFRDRLRRQHADDRSGWYLHGIFG